MAPRHYTAAVLCFASAPSTSSFVCSQSCLRTSAASYRGDRPMSSPLLLYRETPGGALSNAWSMYSPQSSGEFETGYRSASAKGLSMRIVQWDRASKSVRTAPGEVWMNDRPGFCSAYDYRTYRVSELTIIGTTEHTHLHHQVSVSRARAAWVGPEIVSLEAEIVDVD